MATVKDKVVVGSTYLIKYKCTVPVQDDPDYNNYTFDKTPITPTSATILLWDTQNTVYVNLTNPSAPLDIPPADENTPATEHPDTCTIVGNIVSYLIPTTILNRAGDFTAITSIHFADGQVVGQRRQFKTIAKT